MADQLTGAQAMMETLLCEGVDTIFGYPGGSIMPTYDALYSYRDKIRHILTRHEQGAVHAAQGYARASGRTGVVMATSGPGATNLVTGIADAMIDSTPLVLITGQVATPFLGYDAFQEADVIGLTQPIAKWSQQIRRPEDVATTVAKAFYIANSGRPGPVVLDFARNAQVGLTEFKYPGAIAIKSYRPYNKPEKKELEEVAKMINEAERPLILAGHGISISGAEKQLLQLIEKAGIPVASTLLGLSTVPTDHPLYMGMAGMHGNISVNVKTQEADLIIGIGMRFDDRVTGNPDTYGRNAKKIHIDIDKAEFDKYVVTDKHLHGDAKEVLISLLPLVKENKHTQWVESFQVHKKGEDDLVITKELNRRHGHITMGETIKAVSEMTKKQAMVVTDVGQNQMMAARYSQFALPNSIITSGGLGTMGFGLPAAIGAKLGAPERTVVLFTGDGGYQMCIQELGTIMENQLDIKMVILDNSFLGNVRQWQALFFNSHFSATPLLNPDFIMIAKAYGIPGEVVLYREDLPGALQRMMEAKYSYLLDVRIDPTDMVFPMTVAGDDVDNILISPTQHYKDVCSSIQ